MLDKLDLVVEIEELLDECENYPFGNIDDNYPWELVTSPSLENDNFTIENFLLWQEFIEPAKWEEFILPFELEIAAYEYALPEMAKEYRDLSQFLQANLQNIQVYKMNLEGINEEMEEDRKLGDAYCIFGEIEENYWLGIVPNLSDFEHGGKSSKKFEIKNSHKSNHIASNFITKFRSKFKYFTNIFTQSFSDFSDDYKIEVTDDKNLIIEKLFDAGGYCWTTEFRKNLNYNCKLYQLIIDNLLDVRQYNIWGHDGNFIYIGGKTEDGNWMGLYTRQVYVY